MAAKLLDGVRAWADETAGRPDPAAPGASTSGADAPCAWCPVCQAVQRVGATSPEVRTHLASAATSLLNGVASLLEAVAEHQRGHGTNPDPDPPRAAEHG